MMTTIWDLPTRLFHWLLAAAAIGLLATSKIGGDEIMVWHGRLGYCVGTLLMFRLVWGFAGGYWSRFATFPPSVPAAFQYLRKTDPTEHAGHRPLAAVSVYSMLVFFALQVATGLFSETKQDFAGPLSAIVSNATVHFMTAYHKRVGQWVLISLVTLHLAAIGLYAWRGRGLVGAMWNGRKVVPAGTPASRDDARSRRMALALISLCSLVMWAIVELGS
jgi:cytochrome b